MSGELKGTDQKPVEEVECRKGAPSWKFWIRLLISAALLTWLVFGMIPPDNRGAILESFSRLDPWWMALAILLTVAERVLSGLKWLFLLRIRTPELPAWPVMRVFLVTTFLGFFLPSSIGADALRIYSFGKLRNDMAGSAGSVILDRGYGILGLVLMAGGAVLLSPDLPLTAGEKGIILLIAFVSFIGMLLLTSRHMHQLAGRLFGLEKGGLIRSKVQKLLSAFSSMTGHKGKLLGIFSLSFLVQLVRLFIVIAIGYSLGISIPTAIWFALVPVVFLVTIVPISLGGVGVRESLYVFFFSRPEIGVPAASAIALGLIISIIGIIGTLPGAVIYLFRGLGKHEGEDSA